MFLKGKSSIFYFSRDKRKKIWYSNPYNDRSFETRKEEKSLMFTIKLAGIPIGIDNHYDFIDRQCTAYKCKDEPLFAVSVSEEEIERELQLTDPSLCSNRGYGESVCVYRKICLELPRYDTFLFHCAAIEYGGKAYLFSAPSGTGKSTHIKLWRSYLKERVSIINGDKPLIKKEENDSFAVYSSPWAGKEGWQRNCTYPLAGICFLAQAPENAIVSLSKSESAQRALKQVLYPRNALLLQKTLSLVDGVLRCTPVFELHCTISKEAAALSFAALTKESAPF